MYQRSSLGCRENGRPGMGLAVAPLIAAAPTVVETWRKLFGGRDYTNCAGQATEVSESVVARVMSSITPAERAELDQWWTHPRVHNLPFGTDSVQNTAFALAGGKDCRITTAEGKRAREIFDRLALKYAGVSTKLPMSTTDQLLQAGQEIIQGAQAGAEQGIQQAIGQQPAVRAAAQRAFLQQWGLPLAIGAGFLLWRASRRGR